MGLRLPAVLLLTAALLAGCAAGGAVSQPDSPPQEPPAPVVEPVADKEETFVDDPASPYPMAVESWSVDLDGDGRPVLVLWFDSFSRVLDVYALGVQGGEPVLLPVPEGEFQAEPDHWSEWYD